MPVKFKDLLDAFEVTGGGSAGELFAYLCIPSGEVFLHSEVSDQFDTLPDDIDDEEKYVCLPDKRDLGLSKPLALDFARAFLPDDFEEVRQIFSKRGAYPRFHDLLIRRRARDRWHEFEAQAAERALRAWCKDNEIEVDE